MAFAPCSAAWLTWLARASAPLAVSALLCTVPESSSTLAAVCSRLAACCSVRSASALLPLASTSPACDTSAELLRTSATMADKVSTMPSSRRPSTAISPLPRKAARARKSPPVACCMARASAAISPLSPTVTAAIRYTTSSTQTTNTDHSSPSDAPVPANPVTASNAATATAATTAICSETRKRPNAQRPGRKIIVRTIQALLLKKCAKHSDRKSRPDGRKADQKRAGSKLH